MMRKLIVLLSEIGGLCPSAEPGPSASHPHSVGQVPYRLSRFHRDPPRHDFEKEIDRKKRYYSLKKIKNYDDMYC